MKGNIRYWGILVRCGSFVCGLLVPYGSVISVIRTGDIVPLCGRVIHTLSSSVTGNACHPKSGLPARTRLVRRFNIDQVAIHSTVGRVRSTKLIRETHNGNAFISSSARVCTTSSHRDFARSYRLTNGRTSAEILRVN